MKKAVRFKNDADDKVSCNRENNVSDFVLFSTGP